MAEQREPTARDMAMATMVVELDKDPKTRSAFRRLVAEKFPDASAGEFPEIEAQRAVAPILERLEKKEAEFDARIKAQDTAKAREAWHRKLADNGIPETAFAEIEDYASKNATADPYSLGLYYKESRRVAEPSTPRTWGNAIPGSTGSKFFEGIGKDRTGWTRNRAHKDMADILAGRPLEPIDA